jgi:hypothetical protein
LFDPDTVAQIEPSLSANVLNRRFSQRSKEREVRPLVPIRPSQQSVSRHQALSYSAVAYLQLIFNTILIVIFLYIILNIILVLRQDLLIKEKEHMDGKIIGEASIFFIYKYIDGFFLGECSIASGESDMHQPLHDQSLWG